MNNRLRNLFVLLAISTIVVLGLFANRSSRSEVPPLSPPNDESFAVKPTPEPELVRWWREQAELADVNGDFDAAHQFRSRLDGYARSQEPSVSALPDPAALAGAARLAKADLYYRTAGGDTATKSVRPSAKFEPLTGVYLGMLGADKRVGFDFSKIEGVYGRKHAMYLSYVGWRKVQADTNGYFPTRTVDRVKALGGALQIGWEPRFGLEDVKDDEYVRTFAREARASGIPIFLRYASEMNGSWVPWHGDPKLYIEKFRLIHDIMAEEAPNVAMVWSPNYAPADGIDDYYPGDEYVDWVGFSLYATPLAYDGRTDLNESLIDAFAPLYAKYSHKPIMIAEGAVGHTVLDSNRTFGDWAETALSEFYGTLPRLFPQVKAMTYFNYGRAQATRNGLQYVYDLGENTMLDAAYRRMIGSPYFLSQVAQGAPGGQLSAAEFKRLRSTDSLPSGHSEFVADVRLQDGAYPFAVALYEGNRRVGIRYEAPWSFETTLERSTSAGWTLVAYNAAMQPIASSP